MILTHNKTYCLNIQHPCCLITSYLHLLLQSHPVHISSNQGLAFSEEIFWSWMLCWRSQLFLGLACLNKRPKFSLGVFFCFSVCMDLLVTSPVIREECFLQKRKSSPLLRATSQPGKSERSGHLHECSDSVHTKLSYRNLTGLERGNNFTSFKISQRLEKTNSVRLSSAALFPSTDHGVDSL